VSLGDVIVADRVYSYDHGKLLARVDRQGRRTEELIRDIETYNLEKAWAMDAAYFARDLASFEALVRARPRSRAAQTQWLLHRIFDHQKARAPAPPDLVDFAARCPAYSELIPALRKSGILQKKPGVLKLTEKGIGIVKDERLRHPRGIPDDPPFRVHIGPIAT